MCYFYFLENGEFLVVIFFLFLYNVFCIVVIIVFIWGKLIVNMCFVFGLFVIVFSCVNLKCVFRLIENIIIFVFLSFLDGLIMLLLDVLLVRIIRMCGMFCLMLLNSLFVVIVSVVLVFVL